jgi:hypothetical protein
MKEKSPEKPIQASQVNPTTAENQKKEEKVSQSK